MAAAVSEDKEDIQIDVQEGASSQHEPDPAPASTTSSAGSTKVFEGSNIHHDPSGRSLCSYSKKICNAKRLEGYGFCRTHISEDPNSPFVQCTYVSKQTNKQCTHMVTKDTQPILCNTHKQLNTATKKSTRDPKKAKIKEIDSKAESQRKKFSAIMHKMNISHSPYLTTKPSNGDASDSESSLGADENHNSVSSNNAAEEAATRASAELLEKVLEDEDDDESSESDYFREAEILAEEELLKRRKQKIKRLLKLYKAQYKRMRDLLVIRQKQAKKFQQRVSRASSRPLPAPVPMEPATPSDAALQLYYHSNKVVLAEEGMLPLAKKADKKVKEKEEKIAEKPAVVEKRFCAHSCCPVRSLPLTNYCYAHILDDKDQKLFKRCNADQCSYPVLAASSVSSCVLHTEVAAKSEPSEKKHSRKRKPTESELAESAVSPAAQALLSDINQIVKKVQTKRKRSSPAVPAPKIPSAVTESARAETTPPAVPQIFVPGAVSSPSISRSPLVLKTQP